MNANDFSDTRWEAVRDRLAAAAERHDSPLGPLTLAATDNGLVRLGFSTEDEDEDEIFDELAAKVSPRVMRAPRGALGDARRQLDEYFDGRRREFDVDLDWRLVGGFRRGVLEATASIPYGDTGTYRSVAAAAGSPAAVRAAGTARAKNPIPIFVPCHRVLRSDGQIGNYRGGADAKAQLLALEDAR
jgi:methylated-DNA-[protein]-cysteine S-methyltransferase